jgi:hypothetical protein
MSGRKPLRRLVSAVLILSALIWPDPVLAVLRSAALTITDQGRPIPGATLMLTRPHARTARTAGAPPRVSQPQPYGQQPPPPQAYPQQPDQAGYAYPAPNPCPPGYDYAPGYNPECYARPLGATWISGKTDAYGRLILQFDDRQAAAGTLVDITAYYPNGEVRRLFDVPVERAFSGGAIDFASAPSATATGAPGYPPPGPAAYGYPPPQSAPEVGVGILPGIVSGFGVSIGGGGRGDYGRRER